MANHSAVPNHISANQFSAVRIVAVDLRSLGKEEKAIVKVALHKLINIITATQEKKAS